MGSKAWQFIGAGAALPMIGWSLTEILKDNAGAAWVALFFAISLGATCLIGIILANLKAASVRLRLANFITEIEATKERLFDPDAADPDLQELSNRMGTYLRKELGESYVIRLYSNSGLLSMTYRLPPERDDACTWLTHRATRIHEFSHELSKT